MLLVAIGIMNYEIVIIISHTEFRQEIQYDFDPGYFNNCVMKF